MIPRNASAEAKYADPTDKWRDISHVGVAVGMLGIRLLQRLVQTERQNQLVHCVRQTVDSLSKQTRRACVHVADCLHHEISSVSEKSTIRLIWRYFLFRSLYLTWQWHWEQLFPKRSRESWCWWNGSRWTDSPNYRSCSGSPWESFSCWTPAVCDGRTLFWAFLFLWQCSPTSPRPVVLFPPHPASNRRLCSRTRRTRRTGFACGAVLSWSGLWAWGDTHYRRGWLSENCSACTTESSRSSCGSAWTKV